ncbi:DUF1569 domain-containing protein [Flavobacterium sp. 7A]|uniref:DUF1569 domain-containing protein n=1 Tax=Flavobacterium sp. 7A TaxID=2940571 RepID=UPI002226B64C|nr:DUF1569 domain-containing protein [Flavobacterium sp. 7A]MCW2119730.1 hypothetical protein [Flavobacterium sp. 7A]
MKLAQMLLHLNTFLEIALGSNSPKRLFIGLLISKFFKTKYLADKSFSINTPTHKYYISTNLFDFEQEKAKAISLITLFFEGDSAKYTSLAHSFLGYLTLAEWSIAQWKHFDHHLRQFEV